MNMDGLLDEPVLFFLHRDCFDSSLTGAQQHYIIKSGVADRQVPVSGDQICYCCVR